MNKQIAYYRVSTRKQAKSGLGLEGQQAAVRQHAAASGGDVLAEYVEVETGRRADRPELARALAHAKRSKATLVVAKLDRLSRNVAFLSSLMESGVDFVCCDYPTANRLTVHILVAVAEEEARAISERTKAALAAYKARGGRLGSARPGHWKGREHLRGWKKGNARAAVVLREAADSAYADLYPIVSKMRQEGASFTDIARHLNNLGHTRRRGGPWHGQAVKSVLNRYERLCSRRSVFNA